MLSARTATAADLPTVLAITRAAYQPYVEELGGEPLPMTDDYDARVAAGQVFMVARDGADVGLAVLEDAADHLMIFSLAVRPEAHGGGIGRWMLGFAESRARSLGVGEMRLYTNGKMVRNIRVYREAGFAEVGRKENPYRPGWVMVDMVKGVRPG